MEPTRFSDRRVRVLAFGFLLGLVLAPVGAQSAWGQTLAAAVLPTSRSVQVGTTATAFATIINGGATVALGCRIAPRTLIPAAFSYQTTNPSTNQPIGSPNQPADIPPGGFQTFLFSLTPSAAFAPTVVQFDFTCANTDPAGVIPGVNTLLLSASSTPVPDVIAIAATASADGIVTLPGPTGAGAFSVATTNLGASAIITTSADTGSAVLPVDLALCPTNPTNGQCLSAPAATVTGPIDAGTTPTFSIFVTGKETVPFDPANNRIVVRFKDAGGISRGETSVAVRTQTPAVEPVFFHALSDSRPLPDSDTLDTILPVLQLLDCQATPQFSALTLVDAMSSIQSRLDQLAGAGALQGFLTENAQTDASTLAARAGGALTAKKGPGALAALLAAHQNDPTNPAHLVNAAGAAALLGMSGEGLALLDAADAMGGDFGRPMDFNGQAIALNNRGFALIQLGRYAEAQAPLASANSLEPFLAEARMNAAVAQLCQAKVRGRAVVTAVAQDAAGMFLSSLHRSPGQLTADQIFDLSGGVAADLPPLSYPPAVDRLAAYADAWRQIRDGVSDKVSEAFDKRDQAHDQLVQEQMVTPWPRLTALRVANIYDLGDGLGTPTFDAQSPPGLSDLYEAVSHHDTTTFNLYDVQIVANHRIWSDTLVDIIHTCNAQSIPIDNCASYLTHLQQGRTQVQQYLNPFVVQVGAYESAVRAFVDPWSRALTGLAANLSDQSAHQERESAAHGNVLFLFSLFVNRGHVIMVELARWWEEAQAPVDLSGPPLPNGASVPSLDACPGALKGLKAQLNLFDAVDLDISCEKVEAEIATPGLGPFVQLTVPFKGDWTAFMGVKGSLPGASGRFGVYVRGNDTSFTDAGIKSTASIGKGPLKVQSPFNMELGVAAAMQCPLGFC